MLRFIAIWDFLLSFSWNCREALRMSAGQISPANTKYARKDVQSWNQRADFHMPHHGGSYGGKSTPPVQYSMNFVFRSKWYKPESSIR